ETLGAQAAGRPGGTRPPTAEAGAARVQPGAAAGAGSGDGRSPAVGGPADRSAGASGNVVENVPSRGASFGGGDLISFAPDDPADATGVKMFGRFGRRFTNNG